MKKPGRRKTRTEKMVEAAAAAARNKKAERIVVLDMRELSALADAFFICSAANERQVEAIVRAIEERLQEWRPKPIRLEGLPEGRWVVLDYGDVLVHVFMEETRNYYSLESLWGDAPKIFPSEKS